MSNARRVDFVVAALSIVIAVWVTSGLWINPAVRAAAINSGDQALFEWLLGYGAYAVTHGHDPFFTHLLNVPDGVNLAVNTSITAYAVAFAPLTMWLGPPTVFTIILTLNLAGSAFAWYWLFKRLANPLGAAIGGLFTGFAPAMISHANAHLNWTAQWIIPLIILQIIVMYERPKPVRHGLVLGLLIAIAFSLAAEALFFAALAIGLFSIIYWYLAQRPAVGTFLKGIGVAAVTSAILLAYPLYMHFAGPQRYHGTGFDPTVHNEDLAAFFVWPERSLAGALHLNTELAANLTEENSFFGGPLMALVVIGCVLLWRRIEVRALTIVAATFAVLSLGPKLRLMGYHIGLPMPEAILDPLPIFNAALPSRLALVVAPIVGLILAWLVATPNKPGPRRAWIAGFVVALLPLVPLPITTKHREPVPHFISARVWESYVDGEGVLVSVPLPNDLLPDGQRWQAVALSQGGRVFRVPAGFFLGPGGPDGTGRIGPVPRRTAGLFERVAKSGYVPPIGAAERDAAREDLQYWDAQIVVLADSVHGAHWDTHQQALLDVTTRLLGPPERVDDVWLWRVS